LISLKADDFIMPIISGYIQISSFEIKDVELSYIIISRKDHRRSGTRFNSRGLNLDGNISNFVETE
jgi:hypothetical protein